MENYYILKTYTDQLINILEHPIYIIIIKLFEESIFEKKEKDQLNTIRLFQNKLKDIKSWNNDQIFLVYQSIQDDNLEIVPGLIEKIFKLQIKFLYGAIPDNLNIPSQQFIFYKSLRNCASKIYETPFIVDDTDKDELTKFKYNEKINKIIKDSILSAIQLSTINDILLNYPKETKQESKSSSEKQEELPTGDLGDMEKMSILKSSKKSSRKNSETSEPLEDYFSTKQEEFPIEDEKVNIQLN